MNQFYKIDTKSNRPLIQALNIQEHNFRKNQFKRSILETFGKPDSPKEITTAITVADAAAEHLGEEAFLVLGDQT